MPVLVLAAGIGSKCHNSARSRRLHHGTSLSEWRTFGAKASLSGESCLWTGHRPVVPGDCFKKSTAAARRNELAGRTDAVNHHAIADRVLRRFDYFSAQSASDHTSAFLGWRLFSSPLPPSFYAPRHKKAIAARRRGGFKNFETRFGAPRPIRCRCREHASYRIRNDQSHAVLSESVAVCGFPGAL
jgi:hypothetical protein